MVWKLLILFVSIHFVSAVPVESGEQECTTPECRLAKHVTDTMDTTVQPCDNFYEFACNNYFKDRPIPKGFEVIELLRELGIKLNDNLEKLILEDTEQKTANLLVTGFYSACIHFHENNTMTLDSVKQLILDLGGWPLLENKDWTNVSWQHVSYRARELGAIADILLPITVGYQLTEAVKYQVTINLPSFLISQEKLKLGVHDPVVQGYKQNITNFVNALGVSNQTYTENEIDQLLEFETKLANISVASTLNDETIAHLEGNYTNVPWKDYLANIIGTENLVISNDDLIRVKSINYINGLNELLAHTSAKVITNYVVFRAAESIMNLVDKGFSNVTENNQHLIQTREVHVGNPKSCLTLTMKSLPQALSSMYVRKFINPQTKKNLTDLVLKMKESAISIVQTNTWVDNQTRAAAIRKLNAMFLHVAYPEELLDDQVLNEYYEKLKADNNFINFQRNVRKFNLDNELGKYKTIANQTDWTAHSSLTVVNAVYIQPENALQIFAGIIQDQIYNWENPNYVNYALIGAIVGHEINHGFDSTGMLFDEFGILHPWATNESSAIFKIKTECLKQQYLTLNHNTTNVTLNEDIADVGGVNTAYLAYQTWVGANGGEPILPGFNYTTNQLFWIYFAKLWCAKETDHYANNVDTKEPHSRNKYRVLGPLMNSREFSRDFGCAPESYMNPVNKCRIW